MFTLIPGLPDNAVGFEASGEVHSDDYKHTLIPAVEELIARTGRARVLLVLGPEWTGYTPAAMFDDAKLGIEHAKAWERFALVSDADWISHVATLFGWIVPGEIRSYPYAELADAKAWISG